MKFLTQIKSCDVVTIDHGKVQAIKGPIAYFGFHPAFINETFAVDAKMFVAALRKFKDSFYINKTDDKIILFDEKQEVDFLYQPAEQMLDFKTTNWVDIPTFGKNWNTAQKFVSTDFPGIKLTKNYMEVLSDNSIVRIKTELPSNFQGIFASIKLPANIKSVGYYNGILWLAFTEHDFIAINHLEILLPNTDPYFTNWPDTFETIPMILKERFVETDLTVFDTEGVKFVQKEKATAAIENVSGTGSYAGKLFGNIMAHGERYSFQDNFLAFEAEHIQGVIARVRSETV